MMREENREKRWLGRRREEGRPTRKEDGDLVWPGLPLAREFEFEFESRRKRRGGVFL